MGIWYHIQCGRRAPLRHMLCNGPLESGAQVHLCARKMTVWMACPLCPPNLCAHPAGRKGPRLGDSAMDRLQVPCRPLGYTSAQGSVVNISSSAGEGLCVLMAFTMTTPTYPVIAFGRSEAREGVAGAGLCSIRQLIVVNVSSAKHVEAGVL